MTQLYDRRLKTIVGRPRGGEQMTVELCYDDQCRNGHNTFSITAFVRSTDKRCTRDDGFLRGGQLHAEIKRQCATTLAPLIKWHGCTNAGPLHYVANTLYWLGYCDPQWCRDSAAIAPAARPHDTRPPNIEHARKCAVWPDLPESLICPPDVRMLVVTRKAAELPVRALLAERLPSLVAEFHAATNAIEWDVVVPRPSTTP